MLKFYATLLLSFMALTSYAQQKIHGSVTDAATNEPIIGAVVNESGTNNAVMSDIDGMFNIAAKLGSTLTISYLGYTAQTIAVTADTKDLNVKLVQSAVTADEVVIVGFGRQKKENLTGSVAMVNMDKALGDRPLTSVGQALQGQIPGLVITGSSVPGTGMTFNIRGTNSINGGSPLILIDNVPGDIDMVNPEDIESVSVLKDAASAAIYGARGAFGVILVTTKKAKKNTPITLNYNNNFAFQTVANRAEQASISDILKVNLDWDRDGKYYAQNQDLEKWIGYVDQYNNGTLMANNTGAYLENGRFMPAGDDKYYYLKDNDPTNKIIDKFGFQQIHNVSATGGGDKISYRIGLGWTENDGPLVFSKDYFNRINVSSYVNANITKWLSTSLDIRYSRSNRSYIPDGVSGNVYNTYFPRFYPDGLMPKSSDVNGEQYLTADPYNYLMNSDPAKWMNDNPRIFSRTVFAPVKGLEAVFEYTFDQRFSDRKLYTNNFKVINDQMGVLNRSNTPIYQNDKTTTRINAINAFATYEITTNNQKHNFKIMAGYSQEQRYWESIWTSRKDVINPSSPSITGATGEILSQDAFKDYTIRSGFFRFNYNYKEKYLIEIDGRYDGSSKFPTDTRYGFFPSGSIGWQLAKENFMEWSRNWLNEFKIRATFGQIGNQAIDEYQFIPGMDVYRTNWVVNGENSVSLKMPAMVRNNFTWEVVENLDLGLDIALFNNRLQGSFTWYQRDTKGMLAPGMELPGVVGADAPMQNTADLRTTGWELAISWRDRVGDWGYNIGFNIFDYRSTITKFNNEAGLLFNSDGTALNYTGRNIGEIWGYETAGFYTIDDFQDGWQGGNWKLKEGVTSIRGNSSVRPGDIKFVNQRDYDGSTNEISNGDNTVNNPGDQIVIGNNTPRYQFGVNLGVNWKGFDLSLFFNGTMKRDVWLSGDLMFPKNYEFGTVYSHQLDYWKPVDSKNGDWTAQNNDAWFPRIYDQSNNAGSNYRTQTKYLSNGAYLRLKNVTLSYSVPRETMKTIGLTGAKIFFSAENLFTICSLPKGYDPERMSWNYPFYTTYSFGISLTL